jgi:mRNA interferase MazF
MNRSEPSRGEIWLTSFDPIVGHEQSGSRPALVLSVDKFNHGPADLVLVAPVTSKDKHQPWHVPLSPPEGGVTTASFILVEAVRSISKQRLKERWGTVSAATLAQVEMRLRVLLKL